MSEYNSVTGEAVIDQLQGLQLTANKRLEEPLAKAVYIKNALDLLAFDSNGVWGQKFLVETDFALSKHDNTPNIRKLLGHGAVFSGTLLTCQYLDDPNIPLDTLALGFVDPDIMQVETDEDRQYFRECTLQVPILSIGMCISVSPSN